MCKCHRLDFFTPQCHGHARRVWLKYKFVLVYSCDCVCCEASALHYGRLVTRQSPQVAFGGCITESDAAVARAGPLKLDARTVNGNTLVDALDEWEDNI